MSIFLFNLTNHNKMIEYLLLIGADTMKLNTVNRNYFQNKLEESESVLSKKEISKNTEDEIKIMQTVFKKYCGIKPEPEEKKDLTVSEMLENLNQKLKEYLSKIDISTWRRIQDVCWSVRKYECFNHSYRNKIVDINDLANESLKIYKSADKEFYLAAKTTLEDKNTLIYFNNLGIDNHFRCRYLDNNIISCYRDGYGTYPAFIHELQHDMDKRIFTNIQYIYSELAPIFFETLMCDHINKKGNYKGLYGFRIKNNNALMKSIFNNVEILNRFYNRGKELTSKNAGYILNIDSTAELRVLYDEIYNDNLIDSVKYMLSFMKAIHIRHMFYDYKKEGITRLKEAVSGASTDINYSLLMKEYDAYTFEIENLGTKKYTKRF